MQPRKEFLPHCEETTTVYDYEFNKPVRLWYDWRYVGTFIITSTKETLHRPHKIVYEMDNVVTLLQFQWFHKSFKKNFGNFGFFYLMLFTSLCVLFWLFFVICNSSVAFCSFFCSIFSVTEFEVSELACDQQFQQLKCKISFQKPSFSKRNHFHFLVRCEPDLIP